MCIDLLSILVDCKLILLLQKRDEYQKRKPESKMELKWLISGSKVSPRVFYVYC